MYSASGIMHNGNNMAAIEFVCFIVKVTEHRFYNTMGEWKPSILMYDYLITKRTARLQTSCLMTA